MLSQSTFSGSGRFERSPRQIICVKAVQGIREGDVIPVNENERYCPFEEEEDDIF